MYYLSDFARTLQRAARKLECLSILFFFRGLKRTGRATLLRASLEQGECDHRDLKAWAASTDFDDRAKAMGEIRKPTDQASDAGRGL